MTEVLNRRPVADDASAHQDLVRQFRHSLAGLHKQALWLEMPFAAHLIDVAALSAAQAEPDQLPPKSGATGSIDGRSQG